MNNKQKTALILLGGLIGFLSIKAGMRKDSRLLPDDLKLKVDRTIWKNNFNVNADMATAIAIIESGDVDNPELGVNIYASRFELHILDTSTGVMQTLLSTATWLAKDMGYNRYGIPTAEDLYNPDKAIYFGCAYLDWLASWKGQARSEEWIVQSYNAGPNNSSAHYLQKFKRAKEYVVKELL